MPNLYLSCRCPHSREIIDELKRTNNDSYNIIFVDKLMRHMLPPVVTAVPMVVEHNGSTKKGDELFDEVFRKTTSEPNAVDMSGMGGALLDESKDEAANHSSYMQQFYEPMPELPKEVMEENKTVSLEDLQQRRNQNLDTILSGQSRPM